MRTHPYLRCYQTLPVILTAFGIALMGCGGGGGGGGDSNNSSPTPTATLAPTPTAIATPAVGITLAPRTATLNVGDPQTFTASITNTSNTAVTWQVEEGASGGTITSDGVYTAPALAGSYHVDAISSADHSKTTTAVVTVKGIVRITPLTSPVNSGMSVTLQATVLGYANKGVAWSVQEAGGGTVTASGIYTAPAARGTYHVTAVSVADAPVSATTTITVTSGDAQGTVE